MNKQLFLLALFVALLILPSFIQKAKDKIYKGRGFRISYPYNWELAVHEIVQVYPTENDGGVTISTHSGVDMPNEELPAFLLKAQDVQADDTSVMIVPGGNMTEFIFERTKGQVQWLTKAVRRDNELYVITASCALSKWDSSKPIFLKIINSFRLG